MMALSSKPKMGLHRSQKLQVTLPRGRPGFTGMVCRASAEAAKLIVEGKAKYDAGDRMGALRLWEIAMDKSPTPEQRQAALFNQTCTHAYFGDVEAAQIALREAVLYGLDFLKAVEQPVAIDDSCVKMQASQQVLIRLKKFNEATKKAVAVAAAPPSPGPGYSANASAKRASLMDSDLSEVLETDMQGIDTSIVGIIRRVAVLLVLLLGLGAGLFYLGLKYAFPEGPY